MYLTKWEDTPIRINSKYFFVGNALLQYHVFFPCRFHKTLHKDSDIAFHFNPRFNENGKQVIVNGVWGSEEQDTPSFTFACGKSFLVRSFRFYLSKRTPVIDVLKLEIIRTLSEFPGLKSAFKLFPLLKPISL
uniref:Galectin n=1 Tax=Astyanax mexicanus TaxID=7994 RepID=A0A3B1ITM3_ASTMX